MRLILAGAFMTEERYYRHMRVQMAADYPTCRVPKIVLHVSWECSEYQELCGPFFAFSAAGIFPICTGHSTFAGIISTRLV